MSNVPEELLKPLRPRDLGPDLPPLFGDRVIGGPIEAEPDPRTRELFTEGGLLNRSARLRREGETFVLTSGSRTMTIPAEGPEGLAVIVALRTGLRFVSVDSVVGLNPRGEEIFRVNQGWKDAGQISGFALAHGLLYYQLDDIGGPRKPPFPVAPGNRVFRPLRHGRVLLVNVLIVLVVALVIWLAGGA